MQSNLPWIIYAHKIQHNGGSGESMFKYYLNAINKVDDDDLHDMHGEWTK